MNTPYKVKNDITSSSLFLVFWVFLGTMLPNSVILAVTDIVGAGFILTIPDAEEMVVIVIVEREVRVTRILLLSVVIGIVA